MKGVRNLRPSIRFIHRRVVSCAFPSPGQYSMRGGGQYSVRANRPGLTKCPKRYASIENRCTARLCFSSEWLTEAGCTEYGNSLPYVLARESDYVRRAMCPTQGNNSKVRYSRGGCRNWLGYWLARAPGNFARAPTGRLLQPQRGGLGQSLRPFIRRRATTARRPNGDNASDTTTSAPRIRHHEAETLSTGLTAQLLRVSVACKVLAAHHFALVICLRIIAPLLHNALG